MSELQKRTLKGLKWSFIDNISGTGVNFLVGLILARCLTPEIFGIVGVAMIFITISNVVIDGGFSNALIRNPSVTEEDYDTSFIINITTAIVFYGLFFVFSPFIADFFKEEQLSTIIRLIGLSVLIGSLAIVPKARLTRSFDFKRQAIASLSASLLSAFIGIYMAYNGHGIYALVVQQLIRQTIYTVSLWCVIRIYPKLRFSISSARSLFSYGSRILMSGLIDSIYNNLYNFVISKVYSRHHFGLYNRAEQFSSIFAINFSIVIQRVSLPLLTECKSDAERFTKVYQALLRYSTLFASLILLSFCAIADHLIPIVIGSHWNESVPILRILCFAAIFQPMIMINQNILQVFGVSQLFFNIELGKKILAVIIVAVAITFSMTHLLWGIVLIAVISYLVNSYYSSRYFSDYPLSHQLKEAFFYISASGALAFLVYLMGQQLPLHLYLRFLLQLITMIFGGIVLLRFVFVKEYHAIRSIIRRNTP